ncbi:MAG: bifunctional phosphoribosyl-AMP cyclohydrolase/phosphoribosyl-ATP diphosphatase HisIE [Phycisphaerae bacterium]|nr:bifunctional phosphoribosyl-AMP cyclohydrolase/phosphoribosyl-ATP diphosphatase HisIE [Gemmatimonadaceae bacterium]
MLDLDMLDFSKSNGLVTVVTQDAVTGVVLMVAHANREAMEHTLSSGEMYYTSRSRGLWHKGATSGNVQRVVSLSADCDGDAVLARVHPAGPACHTGAVSCFGDTALGADAIGELDATIAQRARMTEKEKAVMQSGASPKPSYTQRLLLDRNLRLKKLGEEAVELATACADADAERGAEEGADVVYHTLVALRAIGVSLNDVRGVLAGRKA